MVPFHLFLGDARCLRRRQPLDLHSKSVVLAVHIHGNNNNIHVVVEERRAAGGVAGLFGAVGAETLGLVVRPVRRTASTRRAGNGLLGRHSLR